MGRYFYATSLLLLFLFSAKTNGNAQTVGVLTHTSGSEDDGYVLFSPQASDTTYLIDKCGREVHKWASSYKPGLDFYLLPDGTLLRTGNYPNSVFSVAGSAGGIIERYDWDNNLLWHYVISDSLQIQNHDICYMPSGNILAAVWEVISDSEALANGRNPSMLGTSIWSAKIVELQPIGTDSAKIVWTWRAWDHLVQDYDASKPNYGVVADHPELLNLNYINTAATSVTNPDWLHFNAITYNPALDQVMISFHNNDEIYILDHSTDSALAASHSGGVHNKGGDFLYRWGNPGAYGRGTTANIKFFQQHDPKWIPSGPYANQIMVFNNGNGRGLTVASYYSSVDIIAPPIDTAGNYYISTGAPYGPTSLSWTYGGTGEFFYSAFMGGAQPLPNGGVLICSAMKGNFLEVDSAKNLTWKYLNPVDSGAPVTQGTGTATLTRNSVYRCTFYPATYSGFAGHTLVPGEPVELDPIASTCVLNSVTTSSPEVMSRELISVMPNPSNEQVTIEAGNLDSIQLFDLAGKSLVNKRYSRTSSAEISTAQLANGMYILCINGSVYQRLVVQH